MFRLVENHSIVVGSLGLQRQGLDTGSCELEWRIMSLRFQQSVGAEGTDRRLIVKREEWVDACLDSAPGQFMSSTSYPA